MNSRLTTLRTRLADAFAAALSRELPGSTNAGARKALRSCADSWAHDPDDQRSMFAAVLARADRIAFLASGRSAVTHSLVAAVRQVLDIGHRNALRYFAGEAGVFMPEQPAIDRLIALGLAEEVDSDAWRHADRYALSRFAREHVLPAIGVRR